MRRTLALAAPTTLLLTSCASEEPAEPRQPQSPAVEEETVDGQTVTEFDTTEHQTFDAPWALEFLPGTDTLLVTERTGALMLRDQGSGEVEEVSGTPEVESAGQGGMHDVIASPTFEEDQTVFFSWVRAAENGSQGVVGRGQLDIDDAELEGLEVIWEQDPAAGHGHFALRMLIHDDLLHVTSGDRQDMDPAQDDSTNLGTVVRLTLEGEPAEGNPFQGEASPADEFWTTGHRNPLGIAEDSAGNLWSSEMGPEGGDELNLLREGSNYGWPEASMGVHYSGEDIADHSADDDFEAPKAHWVPAISPGNLLIYQGELFTGWQDSALLGGLSGENLVRVQLDPEAESAEPVDQWDMGQRIRAVEEDHDGGIWIATDGGALVELRPAQQ